LHEMSLMQNIMAHALEALAPYHVDKVNTVEVEAGLLANVLPDAFTFAFETLTQGTCMEGAELVVCKAPMRGRCVRCGNEYESSTIPPVCPLCGETAVDVLSGTEVYLRSIDFTEVNEHEN